jgi:hypothetical protein
LRTPIAVRVLIGLAVGASTLGASSLKAASQDDRFVWWLWWGAVLVFAVVALPVILIRVSVRLIRLLRSRRESVQHGH